MNRLSDFIAHTDSAGSEFLWETIFLIGIPSFIGNIFDRLFHKKWSVEKRITWYYKQPWEKWADTLGGVKR